MSALNKFTGYTYGYCCYHSRFQRSLYTFNSLLKNCRAVSKAIMQFRNVMIYTYFNTSTSTLLQPLRIFHSKIKSGSQNETITFMFCITDQFCKVVQPYQRFSSA